MTDHDDDDGYDTRDGQDPQFHIPYVPHRTDPADELDGDEQGPDRSAAEADSASGTRVRPAPSGMSRRDRRAWRDLEMARITRVRADAHRSTSARGGFMVSPPKFADRRTRKAWLAGERQGSRQWWERRRNSTADMDVRQRGALVVALLIAALCAWWVISGLHSSHRSATTPAAGGSAAATQVTTSPTSEAAVAAPVQGAVPVGVTPSAGPSRAYSPRTVGPAGEPGRNGTLDHGWSPTPAGGIAPVPPAAPPTPINPATVKIVPAPTRAVTAADRKSPTAAMTAWAIRMCPSSWRQPYGADQLSVKSLMTAAAWKPFDPAADTIARKVFGGVVSLRQVRRCGQISAAASADQPLSSGIAYVHYQGLRVVTSDLPGTAAVVEPMAGQKILLQQRDSSWLVDVDTIGG
jgi:hypothetical protein